ncbi:MAG TPA: N-acetyltransferase [Actinoallomurus sp.]|nr:N-acetyltransferase [Actinoallomurus sp.]
MDDHLFVSEGFAVPGGPATGEFRLEPLGPEHNDADHAAWTSSMDHIRATPGFAGRDWPHEMSLQENLGDLERHAEDFAARRGFTYTVLSADTSEVIGCVYIYPPRDASSAHDVHVSSWVRADRAGLDPVLYDVVSAWLERDWPFKSVSYASRG